MIRARQSGGGRDVLDDILCRKIIDRHWFPCAYRPGFHTERPDSHWFLEQWIPFDYGNQSTKYVEDNQLDLANGRFGDWRYAPAVWKPYHPDHDNYQKKGNCRRWITRCLNMNARIRKINIMDIHDAFKTALLGEDVILAFTDHDYKNMEYDVNIVRNMIRDVTIEYPEVKYIFSDAVTAYRCVTKQTANPIGLKLKITHDSFPYKLIISADNEIFGPQPFLAIKDRNGKYHWDNFDFYKKNVWTYTFDNNTLEYQNVDMVGVAANNSAGVTDVIVHNLSSNETKYSIYNL